MTIVRYAPAAGVRKANTTWSPVTEIREQAEGFVIEIDVPGYAREDIQIKVNEGLLTVSGERKRPEADEKYYNYTERNYGEFTRSFNLPDHVDGETITAQYLNGVLILHLEKKEAAKPHTIEIK